MSRFHPALRKVLKAEANRRGLSYNHLAEEFAMQRFLARVFGESDSPWVLKGGTGLLMRSRGSPSTCRPSRR